MQINNDMVIDNRMLRLPVNDTVTTVWPQNGQLDRGIQSIVGNVYGDVGHVKI